MQNKLTTVYENEAVRHYTRVVAFAVLGVVLGAILYQVPRTGPAPEPQLTTPPLEVAKLGTSSDAFSLPEAAPSRLRIPSIRLDTPFGEPLGVNADRSVEVPESFEEVGYYKYGPTPGELGPSVVLGHVDSYEGPAVFFSLGQLAPGDEIFIDRADGTTATFTVTHLERHEQSGFPTEKVYGNIDHAGLRLITCTGTFRRGEQRYTHNLIVFARLSEPEERGSE